MMTSSPCDHWWSCSHQPYSEPRLLTRSGWKTPISVVERVSQGAPVTGVTMSFTRTSSVTAAACCRSCTIPQGGEGWPPRAGHQPTPHTAVTALGQAPPGLQSVTSKVSHRDSTILSLAECTFTTRQYSRPPRPRARVPPARDMSPRSIAIYMQPDIYNVYIWRGYTCTLSRARLSRSTRGARGAPS